MKKHRLWYPGCLVLLLFSGIVLAEDILIIANNSVNETTISKTKIQQIFLGKDKKWNGGDKIRLAVLKNGPIHESFLSTYLNRTRDRYDSYWKVAVVSGTGYPPKSFGTEADLLKYVNETKGAIGYISSSTSNEGVKLITVD